MMSNFLIFKPDTIFEAYVLMNNFSYCMGKEFEELRGNFNTYYTLIVTQVQICVLSGVNNNIRESI